MTTIVIATLVITADTDGSTTINGLASVAIATDGVTMNSYCYGGE